MLVRLIALIVTILIIMAIPVCSSYIITYGCETKNYPVVVFGYALLTPYIIYILDSLIKGVRK
jgi:hypothetical protein